MPFVGLATGGINFTDQFLVLKLPEGAESGTVYASLQAAKDAGATVFAYGSFVTAVINFLIMGTGYFCPCQDHKQPARFQKKARRGGAHHQASPFCKSEIDIEATRCPHCTSVIEQSEETYAQTAQD